VAAGGENPLLDRLAADPDFPLDRDQIEGAIDARAFTGRSAQQVDEFLAEVVEPLLARHQPAPVAAPRV
jgi:adenylosuccinate lyase